MASSSEMPVLQWSKVKAVVFDVDGTLYNQKRLRLYMFIHLLSFYALRPWRGKELKILQTFRSEREKAALNQARDFERYQYILAAKRLGVDYEKVVSVVDQWIFKAPLQYMLSCRYPGVAEFFAELRERGVLVAILSDYPAAEKMHYLGLKADLIAAATDTHIDCLKPDPRGLLYIAEKLKTPVTDCLFIGDRDDRDGECARRAGMPYLILDSGRSSENSFSSYSQLHKLAFGCARDETL